MRSRLGLLLTILLVLSPAAARAQTACTVLPQSSLLNLFSDAAPVASIVPAYVRNAICSSLNPTNNLSDVASQQTSINNLFGPNTYLKILGSGALSVPSYTSLSTQGTLSGTPAGSSIDVNYGSTTPLSTIAVISDTATNQLLGGVIPALSIAHTFGGTGAGPGARQGIFVDLVQNGNVGSGTGAFQTGIFSNVWARSGTGGGQFYAYAGQVIDDLNVSHYGTVGGEIDLALHQPGAGIKEGWAVASTPLGSGNDTQQGTNYSAGYGLWAGGSCGNGALAGGSACAGFNTGISFGRSDSYWPISNAGTVIAATQGVGTIGNMKAAQGIDMHNVTFSTYALNFPGFQVTGDGSLFAGGASGLGVAKQSSGPGAGPGAAVVRIIALPGTTGGTCKLVAYAGTSTTGVLLADNIGSGC